jgi:site-specific DNA recombinase
MYAYYRCLGTDAYRFGGERVCANPQVRTDLLDLAVWQEVCALLAHPERLAEEYRRRLHAPGRTKRQAQPTLDAQIGKLRQGLARLIDSYAEGLIDKQEFEPRIARLRQRLIALEEQAQQLQDEAALHTELRLIIGRLENFAAQVHNGLAAADWTSKRELIRALVKRVEVTQEQVNVVFRVDQHPTEPDPGKKSLQLRRGSKHSALGDTSVSGMPHVLFHVASFQPLFDQLPCREIANGLDQGRMPDIIKCPFDVSV